MKFLHCASLTLVGLFARVEANTSTATQVIRQLSGSTEGVDLDDGPGSCLEWIVGGDAETGEISNWNVIGSGNVEFSPNAPFGATRSFKMLNRGNVNSGPGQDINIACLEAGKQYKITAKVKMTDENDDAVVCDKYAEWLDPNFCPLFTIQAQTPHGDAKLNLGNDNNVDWDAGIWNEYNAIFTIDSRLESALSARVFMRGPPAGINIYFDDVSIIEHLGEDTNYNFWTTAPPPEDAEPPEEDSDNSCIATTSAESEDATTETLTDSNIVYEHYTAEYDSAAQCAIKNGDAESGEIGEWTSMGAEGGAIMMHNVGPDNTTKAFKHVDRPDSNSGPGQENIDLDCFELGKKYELKAKIKLVDENGFPFACDKTTDALSECDTHCPLFNFVHLSDGEEQILPLPNDIVTPWRAEEFNEYHSIFEVSETFLTSISAGFVMRGPRTGVSMIFDDISMTEYEGTLESTTIAETDALDGPCASLVISGDAETGDINDWEIKDVVSGEFIIADDGPGDKTKSFQHKGRIHVSSGPGQDINATCLVQGKQYILEADVKILDEVNGVYTCDKYAEWKDPDFCPLFTIWIDEKDGKEARYNLGNDYPQHVVWQDGEWNPYYVIFTVDERLAATDTAFIYLRGPRPDATMYFNGLTIHEYVGTNTRFNFWTAVAPETDGNEVSYDFPNSDNQTVETIPEDFEYIYYEGTYAEQEASSGFCEQLVVNGDAEPGVIAGWESKGTGGGLVLMHNEGPMNQTKSFKHINRATFNSGPGQLLDLPCLQQGKLYEVKAKIKLMDHNGFPFKCLGNYINDDFSCPLFTIVVKQPTGDTKYVSKWNDIREVPWYADHFNEFHAIFQVDLDILGGVDAYWYFRGPRADITIALDDVSIKLYEHQPADSDVIVVKPPGCQDLTYNGDASVGSAAGWLAHDGNGYFSIDEDGPDDNGPAFKVLARSHATNGPGQEVEIGCLEKGRKYKVKASYYLEDGKGDPFECDPGAGWNTPYNCPMLSLHVVQPWGEVKFNFFNHIKDPRTPQWNEFETEFTIQRGSLLPDRAYVFLRGPAKDIIFYLNNMTTTMIEDVPEKEELSIPPRDPSFTCESYCCEMLKNGEGEGLDNWVTRPDGDGSIIRTLEEGADNSLGAIKHEGRTAINSGPGQFFSTGCLLHEKLYEVSARVKILDENGDPYSCDKSVGFDDPLTCPLLSIWYASDENLWNNFWFDIPNEDDSEWISGEYNDYKAFFQVDDELIEAVEASIMFRGLPIGAQIIIDAVSMSPYMHEPDFVPEDYTEETQPDFFFESSSLQVNPLIESACTINIPNNDFESGETSGWFVNHGGKIGILRCEENGGEYCLMQSERTSKYNGPKTVLDLSCAEAGMQFDVHAKIKLMDANWEPTGCDKLAGRYSHCPLMTIQYTTVSGEEKWIYVGNDALEEWDKDIYNEFYGTFSVSEEMATAIEAFFYFERPAPGESILLDNVNIKERLVEADEEYKLMTQTCQKFVLNGNAETGGLRGWTARLGGELILENTGADLTHHSIKHTGRRSFIMGPKHELAVNCLTGGMKYNFEAKIKLIDSETGDGFECDKTKKWIDDLSCPLLTFQLDMKDGTKTWYYLGDETKGFWKKDNFNFFQASFVIDERIADAESGFFYVERVRAGVDIVIDEVALSRDCSVLIPNWNAELYSKMPWYQHGGGEVSIQDGGANHSPKTFASTGRLFSYAGPTHMLDVHCLTKGSKYTYSAEFKLLDENDDNKPIGCDKFAPYHSENSCPFFTLVIFLPDDPNPKYLHFSNTYDGDWVPEKYNFFTTEFEVTDEIYSATSAKMIFNGPRAGVAILFDETKLELKVEDECDNLVPNGHFETIEELVGWSVTNDGNLTVYEDGANGSNSSLLTSGRLATNDGPRSEISNMCLFEGVVYEFSAYLKLLDEDNNPFLCDRNAEYGLPNACPRLAIEMTTPDKFIMVHPENEIEDPWVADGWNEFKTKFVISNELANAEKAHFKFKGPVGGISILLDDVKTEIFQPSKVDCDQLIHNTNADNSFTGAWGATGGGYIESIEGGYNSSHAFAHFGRGALNSGPKQQVEVLCLLPGQKYDLNFQIKFIDNLGQPVGCNKAAPWRDPNYCVLITFEMELDGGVKRKHLGNHYGGEWVADEFNPYKTVLVVDDEMASAKSVSFFMQGPSEDKVIVFDSISLKQQETE